MPRQESSIDLLIFSFGKKGNERFSLNMIGSCQIFPWETMRKTGDGFWINITYNTYSELLVY